MKDSRDTGECLVEYWAYLDLFSHIPTEASDSLDVPDLIKYLLCTTQCQEGNENWVYQIYGSPIIHHHLLIHGIPIK